MARDRVGPPPGPPPAAPFGPPSPPRLRPRQSFAPPHPVPAGGPGAGAAAPRRMGQPNGPQTGQVVSRGGLVTKTWKGGRLPGLRAALITVALAAPGLPRARPPPGGEV